MTPRPTRIVFAGTPEFAAVSLRALLAAGLNVVAVMTQPDRPAGRGRKLTPSPVKRVACESGLALVQPASLRQAAEQAAVIDLLPDLLVVVAYGLLLPKQLLDVPAQGCINVHASLLPRWRGAAPIQRAILAGDVQTGVCIMRMDEGLDTGPVMDRCAVRIGDRETAGELHDRLALIGAAALVRTVQRLGSVEVAATPQTSDGVTYAARVHKDEAMLDWSLPAGELDRRVRAFNPAPVAWTTLGEERLRVWRSEPDSTHCSSAPGCLYVSPDGTVSVATGVGSLRLVEMQFPGGRPQPAAAAARAGRLRNGLVFGT